MRFLKVLFWLLLGGLVAAFVLNNGEERVSIHLGGDLIADFSLPLMLILVFLAGLLPALVAYQALRWRSQQRISALERAIGDLRAMHDTAPAEPLDPTPPLIEAAP